MELAKRCNINSFGYIMVQPAETAKSPKEEKPLPPNYISKQVAVDNLLSLRNQLNCKLHTFFRKKKKL